MTRRKIPIPERTMQSRICQKFPVIPVPDMPGCGANPRRKTSCRTAICSPELRCAKSMTTKKTGAENKRPPDSEPALRYFSSSTVKIV